MDLIILIPTFQRPTTLIWSLQSVIRQKFGTNNFKKKIFILNSDLRTKKSVDESVAFVLKNNLEHEFDKISICQANNNLHSIENWFEIVKTNTKNGDVVIIHGDDDIMLPNSLLFRYYSAVASDKTVFIGNCLWSCYFLMQHSGIYLDTIDNPYECCNYFQYRSARVEDLTTFALPFISVYTYKINDKFWSLFYSAIQWSDQLPFERKIKYPFIPYFIGLAAYNKMEMGVACVNLVIRGQLFKKRKFLPPKTITEYANGGIILLTGLAVLNNETLINNNDFFWIRKNHRETTKKHIFQSFFRRDGLTISQVFNLYLIAKPAFTLREFNLSILFKNFRQLFNNILFTSNLKRWFVGWGRETSMIEFWEKWDVSNTTK